MGKNKDKRKIQAVQNLSFTIDDTKKLIEQHKKLFDDKKIYLELETFIIDYYRLFEKFAQEEDEQYNYFTVMFILKNKIMQFICEKIKQGDLDLEINVINEYIKHSNLIKSRLDVLSKYNIEENRYNSYKHLSNLYKNLESDFIDMLWESSIVDAIETYNGSNTFRQEIIKNFKKRLATIDTDFEQFSKKRHKVKVL